MSYQVLVMNYGSTSTKIAVYKEDAVLESESIQHDPKELMAFENTMDQKDFRQRIISKWLIDHGFIVSNFDAIISRGGVCKPIPGGIYEIDAAMVADIYKGQYGIHPAGLGCIIAREMSKTYGVPALTANPPVTDEFCELARYSGIKDINRISSFHALNHKAIAKKHCEAHHMSYDNTNFVIVHLGGGISVASHRKGLVIDANNALDGDGPFAPERSGSLPVGALVKMCFSGNYSEGEILKKLTGGGGLMSYLGTSSALEVEKMIATGNTYARTVYEAMAFQVAKSIGGAATVLKGDVNAILLTGSIAHSKMFTHLLKEYIAYIAPVYIYPGENEMLSLAENAFRYLNQSEKPLSYN